MTLDEELKSLERKNTAVTSEDEPMTLLFTENKNKNSQSTKTAKMIKS